MGTSPLGGIWGHLKARGNLLPGDWNNPKAHSRVWHLMPPVAGTLVESLGQSTYTWPPHVAACLSHGMEADLQEERVPVEQGRKHIALLCLALECDLLPYSFG